MTTGMARDYLDRAGALVLQSRQLYERADWALCIARAAEAVEFSLKAAIRGVGGGHKLSHDVSGDLLNQDNYQRFPSWFQEQTARFSLISKILSELYPRARYGLEVLDAPPSQLFMAHEAEAYLKNAEEVYYACSRLLAEMNRT